MKKFFVGLALVAIGISDILLFVSLTLFVPGLIHKFEPGMFVKVGASIFFIVLSITAFKPLFSILFSSKSKEH